MQPIDAVPVRRPGRWIAAIAVALVAAAVVRSVATNPRFEWGVVGEMLFSDRILHGLVLTLELTAIAMVAGVALGILVAVARMSPNRLLSGAGGFYVWLFRGTPVYVQLVFWGLIALIYQSIEIGIPFTDVQWASFATAAVINTFWLSVIGLGLNEAAYMSEIVRAGLLSVDPGQDEAATALGMSWGQSMRRVILPQAMRVIIPPTGNEVISMLKTTSLVTAVPFSFDLYNRSRDISAETFNPVPMLIVASLWYLFFTSILMVGQYFLEKRFARGVGERRDGGPKTEALPPTGTLPVVGANQPNVVIPPTSRESGGA